MPRYIDAERMPSDKFWEDLTDKEKAKVLAYLLASPTVDVEEVRHGKWIFVDGYVTCSECGARPFRFLNRFDFDEIDTFMGCPHCRAKMDGKEK